jgi:hypothetical protein
MNSKAFRLYNSLGNPVIPKNLQEAYEEGMIHKDKLVHSVTYGGYCRNADVAVWDDQLQRFIYIREKFKDTYCETIVHPEDDRGFDIFVPVEMLDSDPLRDTTELQKFMMEKKRRLQHIQYEEKHGLKDYPTKKSYVANHFDGDYNKYYEDVEKEDVYVKPIYEK